MAEFFWGGSAHKPLPVDAETGDWPFDPRADRPVIACTPKKHTPRPEFFEKQFATGRRGYSSGGRLNTRPRWRADDVVDRPDRLEMTIFAARRVVYAGRTTCDAVIRNTRRFRPRPGEEVTWSVTDLKTNKPRQRGRATVDAHGLIHVADLQFAAPGRLVLRAAGP